MMDQKEVNEAKKGKTNPMKKESKKVKIIPIVNINITR